MSKKLYNSLIEYIVVAGCNNDTGLVVFDENEVKIGSTIIKTTHFSFILFKLSIWSMNQIRTGCI